MGNRPLLFPMLIAGILALVGIAELPYGYYEFLRWVLTAASITLAVVSWNANQKQWLLLSIPVFLLWFPPFHITMDKSTWAILDFLAGLALIISGFMVSGGNTSNLKSVKEP